MKKSIRHKMNAETRRYHRKQFITRTVISVLRALFLIGICFTVI